MKIVKIVIPSPEYDALMRRYRHRLSLSPKLLAMLSPKALAMISRNQAPTPRSAILTEDEITRAAKRIHEQMFGPGGIIFPET